MAKPTFSTGDVPTASQVNDWMVNVQFVRKATTESLTSNTTLQDDDELVLPVAANTTYELTMVLRYDADTAGDISMRITVPAGASFSGFLSRLHPSAVGSGDASVVWIIGGPDTLGGTGAGVDGTAQLQGLVIVGGTAGNVRLQWAQAASSAVASRVFAGSYMKLTRVA